MLGGLDLVPILVGSVGSWLPIYHDCVGEEPHSDAFKEVCNVNTNMNIMVLASLFVHRLHAHNLSCPYFCWGDTRWWCMWLVTIYIICQPHYRWLKHKHQSLTKHLQSMDLTFAYIEELACGRMAQHRWWGFRTGLSIQPINSSIMVKNPP
jgi:hypothetical protein